MIAERYQISQRLGTGGHAVVYFGHDVRYNQAVAIKELQLDTHLKAAYREDLIQRFYQEARIAKELRHPHIVAVYDVITSDDQYLMILEYVDGLPLDLYLEEKNLTLRQTLDILIQTADALGYAHRKNIVHRDIKPQNLLIDQQGQAKLMDFGIAKSGDDSCNTSDGSMLGTMAYMSPEQLQNSRNVCALSDIYSFGVMMYELFSGTLPFPQNNLAELVTAIFCHLPPLLHEKNPQMPPELSAVVAQAMGRETHQRYANMPLLRDDLVRCRSMIAAELLQTPLMALRPKPAAPPEAETPTPLRNGKKPSKAAFYEKYLAQPLGAASEAEDDLGDWLLV